MHNIAANRFRLTLAVALSMAGCAPAATVPVYLAQGGKDEQVPPEDVDALLKALQKAGNKRVQAKTYPELSHLFAPTKTGSMADYSDPDLNMSEEFLGDAVAFLSSALKK